jgi:hypothetical protein
MYDRVINLSWQLIAKVSAAAQLSLSTAHSRRGHFLKLQEMVSPALIILGAWQTYA